MCILFVYHIEMHSLRSFLFKRTSVTAKLNILESERAAWQQLYNAVHILLHIFQNMYGNWQYFLMFHSKHSPFYASYPSVVLYVLRKTHD